MSKNKNWGNKKLRKGESKLNPKNQDATNLFLDQYGNDDGAGAIPYGKSMLSHRTTTSPAGRLMWDRYDGFNSMLDKEVGGDYGALFPSPRATREIKEQARSHRNDIITSVKQRMKKEGKFFVVYDNDAKTWVPVEDEEEIADKINKRMEVLKKSKKRNNQGPPRPTRPPRTTRSTNTDDPDPEVVQQQDDGEGVEVVQQQDDGEAVAGGAVAGEAALPPTEVAALRPIGEQQLDTQTPDGNDAGGGGGVNDNEQNRQDGPQDDQRATTTTTTTYDNNMPHNPQIPGFLVSTPNNWEGICGSAY